MHYQVRDGKYLSLKPYGKPKAVRSRSLGPGYGKEDLIARIKAVKVEERSGQFVVYGDVQAIRLLMIGKREKNRNFHLTPFQRQFYYRWRNTCFIRRPEIKDAWKYKKDVVRGQVIAKPGSITPHSKFIGALYVLTADEGGRHSPFFTGYRPQFYFRTTDITGTVILPDGVQMVKPGDHTSIKVELIHKIAMDKGLRFAIREGGKTVASGQVTEIDD